MSVGGIGRGGGSKRTGSAKGASGKAPAGRAGAGTFGKVDRTTGLIGVSGAAGSGNVESTEAVLAPDSLSGVVRSVAGRLKRGDFKDESEARYAVVEEILRDKLRVKSEALTRKIADSLQDDPRFNRIFERLWSRAG